MESSVERKQHFISNNCLFFNEKISYFAQKIVFLENNEVKNTEKKGKKVLAVEILHKEERNNS